MSIQPIPPSTGPTTAGQLAARATANDQHLLALLGDRPSTAEVEAAIRANINFVPTLTSGTDLDTLTGVTGGTGTWRANASQVTNAPPGLTGSGWLIGRRVTAGAGFQQWLTDTGSLWQRSQFGGPWREWVQIYNAADPVTRWNRGRPAAGTDLNALTTPGTYHVAAADNALNYPFSATLSSTIEVQTLGSDWITQRATSSFGHVRTRVRRGTTTWTAWSTPLGPGSVAVFASETEALAYESANPGAVGLYIEDA